MFGYGQPPRKKAKYQHNPTDRNISIPNSELFNQLIEQEKRLDALIDRKRIDMVEALKTPQKANRTLRIHVCNDFTPESEDGMEPASWTLKISGGLLTTDGRGTSAPKFSSFFRRIYIQLDPNAAKKEEASVEWKSSLVENDCDGFEIKRVGSRDFDARIFLYLDYNPKRFKVSPDLARIINVHTDNLPAITLAFWQYVSFHKLQDSQDRKLIKCDANLKKVFGCNDLEFSEIPAKLSELLLPPDPIEITYTIKTMGDKLDFLESYDVDVQLEDEFRAAMSHYVQSAEDTRLLQTLDESLNTTVTRLKEASRRRQMLLNFSKSPVDFLRTIIKDNANKIKIMQANPQRLAEEERMSSHYEKEWVHEAILRYLHGETTVLPDPPTGSSAANIPPEVVKAYSSRPA